MAALAYDLHLAARPEGYDRAGLARGVSLHARIHHIIHTVDDLAAHLVESLRGLLTRDVCRGRDYRLAEPPQQLLAELVVGHANTQRPRLGDEVRGHANGPLQNQRQRLGRHLQNLEGYARRLVDVTHDHVGIAAQHQHRVFVDAAFKFVDALHGLLVRSVAPYAPHRIGGIEDQSPASQHLKRRLHFLFHHNTGDIFGKNNDFHVSGPASGRNFYAEVVRKRLFY